MSITFRWSVDCKAWRELVVIESGSIAADVVGVSMPSYSESLYISVAILVKALIVIETSICGKLEEFRI
jgi:hypothetical protein